MKSIAPQLIVNNISESVEFYTQKLGFTIEWIHEKNPMFAIISRGGVTLMLRQLNKKGLSRPNREPFIASGWHHTDGKEAWDAYIWTDDVKSLYNECLKNDISMIKPLRETEYGNIDFEIEDIDGYILCFGEVKS